MNRRTLELQGWSFGVPFIHMGPLQEYIGSNGTVSITGKGTTIERAEAACVQAVVQYTSVLDASDRINAAINALSIRTDAPARLAQQAINTALNALNGVKEAVS